MFKNIHTFLSWTKIQTCQMNNLVTTHVTTLSCTNLIPSSIYSSHNDLLTSYLLHDPKLLYTSHCLTWGCLSSKLHMSTSSLLFRPQVKCPPVKHSYIVSCYLIDLLSFFFFIALQRHNSQINL